MYPDHGHKYCHHDRPIFLDDLIPGDRFTVSPDMFERIGSPMEQVFVKLEDVQVVDTDGSTKTANCRDHYENSFYLLSGDIRVFKVDESTL
jgi:hypothetical protein